jgi:hypothetical protein
MADRSSEKSFPSTSSPPTKMVAANLTTVFNTLITGLHILHYNGVLDAYGHVSVRNPNNGSNFFMSRNLAPALVANSSDLVEYYVEDAAPIDPNAPSGFIERYIHSELYKRFPSINSVVHSHSPQVVPFTFSGVPLRPSIHMAGFLGMHKSPSERALLILRDQAMSFRTLTSPNTTSQARSKTFSSAHSVSERRLQLSSHRTTLYPTQHRLKPTMQWS